MGWEPPPWGSLGAGDPASFSVRLTDGQNDLKRRVERKTNKERKRCRETKRKHTSTQGVGRGQSGPGGGDLVGQFSVLLGAGAVRDGNGS